MTISKESPYDCEYSQDLGETPRDFQKGVHDPLLENTEDSPDTPFGESNLQLVSKRCRKQKRKNLCILLASITTHLVLLALVMKLWTDNGKLKAKIEMLKHVSGAGKNFYEVDEPYSPAEEAVEYELHQLWPDKTFQSEPSDEVDEAWERIQGIRGGVVFEPSETAAKLSRSIEYPSRPGNFLYVVEVFHQLHCLDRIRKSFYRERYFPGMSDKEFNHHKTHCIDYIRQHLMCAGNVQLNGYWSKKFTTTKTKTMPDGTSVTEQEDSEYYKGLSLTEREQNSFGQWNIVQKCRNFDKLLEWANDPVRMAANRTGHHENV